MASAEQSSSPALEAEGGMSPGEFVLKKLFAEFVQLSESKLLHIASQPLDLPLAKCLQKGEDTHFDQLLNALNEVASFCLRSILTAIFKWRDMQLQQCRSNTSWPAAPAGDKDLVIERQELAIDFLFCLVLVDVLTKLSVHPVPESFIHTIEDSAFRHFKQQGALKDRAGFPNPNIQNMKKVADLYAEVIGVLSQSRFHSVRRRFFHEIRVAQNSSSTIISIIEGMSFVRVKMFPVEEVEQWFAFLQECGNFFLDCGREKLKGAMSSLLVEVLLPVASVIKFEASLPAVRKFVSSLYSHCCDNARRTRHSNAYIPLVTALLAISEPQFFLNHWNGFLKDTILPNIRKDSKAQQHRTALEALNRLVWVYMVRIKGESNVTTYNRLRMIGETLFPRGQKVVVPKDMPLNIFVKMIQFIARERLEWVMGELILEQLLNLGRQRTNINPERMIIGLRAFLVIADSLEKKEGDPPMPLNVGPLPSGGPARVKPKFLSNTLTDETAKRIGVASFYPAVRRALDGILRALDHSVGRPFTSTNQQVTGRPEEEVLGGVVKPKLDLLRTCVIAIPRIMPEGMSRDDLLDLLSRLTIHLNHELVCSAFNSLQSIITNFPSWRQDVVVVFCHFTLRDIPDSCPLVLEAALKMIIQMVTHWRALVSAPPSTSSSSEETASSSEPGGGEVFYCIPWLEAIALVTLCSYRAVTRRLSLVLLKEVRHLHEALHIQSQESTVLDVIEKATPTIIKRYLATLTFKERSELRLSHQSLNLTWMADRSSVFLEQGGSRDSLRDAWAQCLAGLLEPQLLPKLCPSAVLIAWPYSLQRMNRAYAVLDPGSVAHQGERPSSLKSRRPVMSSVEMFLWRNYLLFVSGTAPPSTRLQQTSVLPDGSVGGGRFGPRAELNARNLFVKVVPLIRSEGEIKEVAITALGLVHPDAFGDLVEELQDAIHDALDQRRGDNPRKKRRREVLRVQITRVFALAAEHGCFRQSPMARSETGHISPVLLEFVEGIKNYLEAESDRMQSHLQELRLHFSAMIASIISSVPRGDARLRLLSADLRYSLFYLFANWCALFGVQVADTEDSRPNSRASSVSFNALQGMSALLCCGPVFHPKGLDKDSSLYHWLGNMLSSGEPRVQTLGRKTVQLLLENNAHPSLLAWVVNCCYDGANTSCAQLCFHALSNTLAALPSYPCDMVTVLHVVLYKTADMEHSTRERATHLLQVLDRRFFASGVEQTGRPELVGCLTAGAFSQSHVALSTELALANPELTLPLFCEMVARFEVSPPSGQRAILQYMVPWLKNVELLDDSLATTGQSVYSSEELLGPEPANSVLRGSGWGSVSGTKVILHNMLYITAKYGDEFMMEVEDLWCALCTWPQNIRVAINYLARLTCVTANTSLMITQAKRVMVCFGHAKSNHVVTELVKDLQSVELISADLQVKESPPFYRLTTTSQQRGGGGGGARPLSVLETTVPLPEGLEGEAWAVAWRLCVKMGEGAPVPLPLPSSKTHFASLRDMLKAPARQPNPLHRCNFSLLMLSELVLELPEVDWAPHLPLLLHVILLGLDLLRPLVCDHSKRLLGNLVVVLACKDNKMAALQARFAQQEACLRSPSSSSSLDSPSTSSLDSFSQQLRPGFLSEEARDLILFVSSRESHRYPWPFADLSSRPSPSGDVPELGSLVGKMLSVFQHLSQDPLNVKWAKIALQWATSCSSHQYASQSFQVCRALQLPLSSSMFREVLTRLAESASEEKDDMQSYVLEIILTLESAVDHVPDEDLRPNNAFQSESPLPPPPSSSTSPRKVSELPPLPSETPELPSPLSPPSSAGGAGAGVRRRHSRGRSVTSKADMMSRPSTAKARITEQQQPGDSEVQVRSPIHVKSTTVSSFQLPEGGVAGMRPRPLSAVPVGYQPTRPLSVCREQSKLTEKQSAPKPDPPVNSTDGGAQPLTATDATKPPTREHKMMSASFAGEVRSRKASEPPPSLQVLFDRDMGSSRRWMHKQVSVEEVKQQDMAQHPKQHSLDNSQLRSPQTQSPRLHRRVKSPSTSYYEKADKNVRDKRLNSATSSPQISPKLVLSVPPPGMMRATSTLQLKTDLEEPLLIGEGGGKADLQPFLKKQKELSRSKESLCESPEVVRLKKVPSRESLVARELGPVAGKEHWDRSAPSKDTQLSAEVSEENTQAPLINQQGQPPGVGRLGGGLLRRNSSQLAGRSSELGSSLHSSGSSGAGRKLRPHSMFETSSYGAQYLEQRPMTSDLLAQLFWTSASLLESDYEGEFSMALRLLTKVFDRLDLAENDSHERLDALLAKMKWGSFPGVQALLLKGLTLEATSQPTRELLSRVTLYSTRAVFDPSQFAGLPLNIMALMPVLVEHFSDPTPFCVRVVAGIQQACTSVELPSEEGRTKLGHMSKMFQMYSTRNFPNSCDVWLAGICRYLNDVYATLADRVLSLLIDLLERGVALYHRAVLRLLYEYLRLQDPTLCSVKLETDRLMAAVGQHIKGPLWREALDLLKLSVANSASLVQPPTRGLNVDLGMFNQTLPGPTLQFSMDLLRGSPDLQLAGDRPAPSSWKRPQLCQRRTRERLISVLNACVPVPVLMSSPSVVFNDALTGDMGTLYSSTSEEAESSIASINPEEMMDSSQQESQSYINAVGTEFHFLESFEYMYDDSSIESETPGPFSRQPFTLPDKEYEPGSLGGSLAGSLEDVAGASVEEAHSLEGGSEDELAPLPTPEPPAASPYPAEADHSTTPSASHSPEQQPDSLDSTPLLQGAGPPADTGSSPEPSAEDEEEEEEEEPLPVDRTPSARPPSHPAADQHEPSPDDPEAEGDDFFSADDFEHSFDEFTSPTSVSPRDTRKAVSMSPRNSCKSPSPRDGRKAVSVSPHVGRKVSSKQPGQPPPQNSSQDSRKALSMSPEELRRRPRIMEHRKAASMSPASMPRRVVVAMPTPAAVTGVEGRDPAREEEEEEEEESPAEISVDFSRESSNEPSTTEETSASDDQPAAAAVSLSAEEESPEVEQPAVPELSSLGGDTDEQPTPEELPELETVLAEVSGSEQPLPLSDMSHDVSHDVPKEPPDMLEEPDGTIERGSHEPSEKSPDPSERSHDSEHNADASITTSELLIESRDQSTPTVEPATEQTEAMSHDSSVLADKESLRSQDSIDESHGQSCDQILDPLEAKDEAPSQLLIEGASSHLPEASQLLPCHTEEEVWQDHVTQLCQHKQATRAVHTYFLFSRLFGVLRHQLLTLTREACVYLGGQHSGSASHFLVTTEVLLNQFRLPRVYVDSELISRSGLLEQHVLLVQELHDNLSAYLESRGTVQEVLAELKQALREEGHSEEGEAALCKAVHKYHFQLLLVLGSYVSLLSSLQSSSQPSMCETCRELTEVSAAVEEAVMVASRGPSPPLLDHASLTELQAMGGEADATAALEECVGRRQYLRAVQLLHTIRKQWPGAVFGSSDEDDVDSLFFIYARQLLASQEGVVCVTEHVLADVHGMLMAQSDSLHSLLQQQQQQPLNRT